MNSIDKLEKALRKAKKAANDDTQPKPFVDTLLAVEEAAADVRRRVDYHVSVNLRVDNWLPACNGTETPFQTRSGLRVMYCWNPATGKHAYLDLGCDMILTDAEAQRALA